MDPTGPLPHSQKPITSLYPEPDRSSPCPYPASRRSILILSSDLRLGLPSDILPSGFSTKPCIHLCSPSHVLYALPISAFLTKMHLYSRVNFTKSQASEASNASELRLMSHIRRQRRVLCE